MCCVVFLSLLFSVFFSLVSSPSFSSSLLFPFEPPPFSFWKILGAFLVIIAYAGFIVDTYLECSSDDTVDDSYSVRTELSVFWGCAAILMGGLFLIFMLVLRHRIVSLLRGTSRMAPGRELQLRHQRISRIALLVSLVWVARGTYAVVAAEMSFSHNQTEEAYRAALVLLCVEIIPCVFIFVVLAALMSQPRPQPTSAKGGGFLLRNRRAEGLMTQVETSMQPMSKRATNNPSAQINNNNNNNNNSRNISSKVSVNFQNENGNGTSNSNNNNNNNGNDDNNSNKIDRNRQVTQPDVSYPSLQGVELNFGASDSESDTE